MGGNDFYIFNKWEFYKAKKDRKYSLSSLINLSLNKEIEIINSYSKNNDIFL
jgi:hypothetical protein